MIHNAALKGILPAVLVSLLLLTPVLNIPGPLAVKSLDVYAAAFFFVYAFFMTLHGRLPCKRILSLVLGAFAILFIHMLFLEIIYGYGDSTGISMVLRSAIWVFVSYGCAQFLINRYREQSLVFFIKVVIACAILQGLVLWLTFLSTDFREFMSVIFYRDFERDADHLILLRTPGFVPTSGDGLSMNQALLATVGLIGANIYFQKNRYQFLLVAILIISMLSTAFAGRAGLYLGIFFALIIIATRKGNFQISRKLPKILVAGTILALPIILFSHQIGNYGQVLLDQYGYEYPLVRLLRGFIDMQSTGVYSDRIIETLLIKMFVVPEEPLRFLVGNNDFGQLPSASIGTDVGYFRMWHGVGILGLILFTVAIYLLPAVQLYLSKRYALRNVRYPVYRRCQRQPERALKWVV